MPKGQINGTRITWDDSAKSKLYQAIIDCNDIPTINWQQTAAKAEEYGLTGVTAVACNLQYQKCKKLAKGTGEKTLHLTPVSTPKKSQKVIKKEGYENDGEKKPPAKKVKWNKNGEFNPIEIKNEDTDDSDSVVDHDNDNDDDELEEE